MLSNKNSQWTIESFLDSIKESPADTIFTERIHIHFDVPNNMISARTLAEVADGLQIIADVVFAEITEDKEKPEIYLCVPKKGSYEAEFAIFICGAIVPPALYSFTNTLSEDLFGKSLDEIMQILAHSASKSLKNNFYIYFYSSLISVYLTTLANAHLPNSNSFPLEKTQAQKGKNKIFEAAQKNDTVNALSLDGKDQINRTNFDNYIDKDIETKFQIMDIGFQEGTVRVDSPVSINDNANKRGWAGHLLFKSGRKKHVVFSMGDENFKSYIDMHDIKPAVDDIMKIQLVKYPDENPHWKAVRVLEFRGIKISDPLDQDELQKLSITSQHISNKNQSNQLSLPLDD